MTKLAVDHLEETGRPFRLAIDISIWQFQAQAARGGSNPAIRTLFYRLLRLLSLCIQPIFVFDGPNKPTFKRNKRAGRGDGVATSMAKRIIRLFGFLVHDAPGEAEAECALLQQQGVVDAVLSEDVDTIMFGCQRTLRNWSAEGAGKAKTPTHVSMYDAEGLRRGDSGLDREGMVLVALMSGGDYVVEGIPGAGVKLACEAARAGFGRRLCQLKRSDTSGLNSWREWLLYELRTNESGFFRTKHKALHVPDSFPNLDVLRYYTHPVVSPAEVVERLRAQQWEKPVDVQGLREFGRETFDWNYRIGAVKFIRVLAPCLLVRKLMDRSANPDLRPEDIEAVQAEETSLVGAIKSRRAHASTDETPELRLSFIPTEIVGYDFQNEPDEVISYGRDGLALNSDDEFDAAAEDEARPTPKNPFSPTEPDLHWVPETIAKFGVPLMVEDWEARQRMKKGGSSARQKTKAAKPKTKPSGPAGGALDKFMKVTKNISKDTEATGKPGDYPPSCEPNTSTSPAMRNHTHIREFADAAMNPSQGPPSASALPSSRQPEKTKPSTRSSRQAKSSKSAPRASAASTRRKPAPMEEQPSTVNPWTIASSQLTPKKTASASSHGQLRAAGSSTAAAPSETIIISSSPPAPPARSLQTHQHQEQQPLSTPPRKEARSGIQIPSSPPAFSSPPPDGHDPSPPRHKRRSITPPPVAAGPDDPGTPTSGYRGIAVGTPPRSSERPRRKLARTAESVPVESPGPRTDAGKPTRGARGLVRAQTIAVAAETMVLSLDSEDENENERDDGIGRREGGGEVEDEASGECEDLPPISSLVVRNLSGGEADAAGTGIFTSSPPSRKPNRGPGTTPAPVPTPTTPTRSRHRQTTLDSPEVWRGRDRGASSRGSSNKEGEGEGDGDGTSGRPRMTKLYVPRKSAPGFFKEVDVTADEAEALKAHVAGRGGGRACWRRSDIQCVDLTGED